ncbi:MAG: hypothetical protein D6760_09380 [Deltaproteobacteria bacterium]|nr:MAG: hypothetical protein D6760_09380 [Deltaproteobacteria bacterium]
MAIFAANVVCRTAKWLDLGAPMDDPVIRRWCRREDRIVRLCRGALKLRAGELVALCERMDIRGCSETLVRRDPFLVALAVKRQLHGGIKDED